MSFNTCKVSVVMRVNNKNVTLGPRSVRNSVIARVCNSGSYFHTVVVSAGDFNSGVSVIAGCPQGES